MNLKIDFYELAKMKNEAKRHILLPFIILFFIFLLFLFTYIILCFISIPKITSGLILILYGLFNSIFMIYINNYRIDKCFKKIYSDENNRITFEITDKYLLMHNLQISKELIIYRAEIKKIYRKSNCSIVILKNRDIYVFPKLINISLYEGN